MYELKLVKKTCNTLLYITQYTQTLTLVTQWYNQLQSTILAVEVGLVTDEIDETKRQLDPALRELTWSQDDLWDYIQRTRDMVKVLNVSYRRNVYAGS